MGTTTNNGWPTPVATDLVKDGWEAIKDLGDAIDTTLGVYSPATPMGVLLSSTSFSGVASTSLAADTFTSTYDNYKIIFIVETASTDNNILMRLRASGSDDSTSVYNAATSTASSLNQTSWALNETTSLQKFYTFELYYPKAAKNTYIANATGMFESGGVYAATGFRTGYFRNTTSFDAMSFIANTGTITGKYFVYAFNM
jgi:hypothetical protein